MNWKQTAIMGLLCAGLLCGDPVPREEKSCPGTAIEKAPTLVSDLEPLKREVRSAGYQGHFLLTLTVNESGSVRDPEIRQPVRLRTNKNVLRQVHALRFCPAVKFSRYSAVPLQFDISVGNFP